MARAFFYNVDYMVMVGMLVRTLITGMVYMKVMLLQLTFAANILEKDREKDEERMTECTEPMH